LSGPSDLLGVGAIAECSEDGGSRATQQCGSDFVSGEKPLLQLGKESVFFKNGTFKVVRQLNTRKVLGCVADARDFL
jgi:hypothetical protein